MITAGIILLLLAAFGVLRSLTIPLGVILVISGIIVDVLHFVIHGFALLF